MSTRALDFLTLQVLLFAALQPCIAQISPAAVKHCKQATVLVEAGRVSGSAFCVDPSGLIVTNEHVVAQMLPGAAIKIVIWPGELEQKTAVATVIRVDRGLDLALLRLKGNLAIPWLQVASTDDLWETVPVAAFGYPFGKNLALHDGEYPTVTVSTGRITSLRRNRGILEQIQLDAAVSPGSSGGPVVNEKGEVIGIVQAGIEGAALNFAIPANQLSRFLAAPTVDFEPPNLTNGKDQQTQLFDIHVSCRQKTPLPTVALILTAATRPERRFEALFMGGDLYRVKTLPLLPSSAPKELELSAVALNSSLACRVPDRRVVIGAHQVSLSRIREIDQGSHPQVSLDDGSVLPGHVTGMNAVQTILGGTPNTIDLTRFTTVFIREIDSPINFIGYTIKIKQAGTIIGQIEGSIPLHGMPGPAGSTASSTIPRGNLPRRAFPGSSLPGTRVERDSAPPPRHAGPAVTSKTSEILSYQSAGYRYLVVSDGVALPAGFEADRFDDSQWLQGDAAFGTPGTWSLGYTVRTFWKPSTNLLARKVIILPHGATNVRIMMAIDNDIKAVFFNGTRIAGAISTDDFAILDSLRVDVPQALIRPGQNIIAWHVADRGGADYFDARILAETGTAPLNPA